jgi:hypothetical protein
MYRSRFTGICNRCGLCCQFEAADGTGLVRCGYLAVEEHIGTAGATRCVVHERRVDGMPIPMFYARDLAWYGWRQCAKDSPTEDHVIAARGIGRGCSLEAR